MSPARKASAPRWRSALAASAWPCTLRNGNARMTRPTRSRNPSPTAYAIRRRHGCARRALSATGGGHRRRDAQQVAALPRGHRGALRDAAEPDHALDELTVALDRHAPAD